MLFKRTAIFFLTLASAILLLHNLIPHSHDNSDVIKHSHSHDGNVHATHHHDVNNPSEDENEDESEMANILSIINHQTEGIAFLTGLNNSNAISKQLLSAAFLIPENYCLSDFILPPLLYDSSAEFLECTSFYPCTNELRGPPAIAV